MRFIRINIISIVNLTWIELISGLLGVHKQFFMVSTNDKAERMNFLFTNSFIFDRVTKLLNKHASRLWTHLHHLNTKISRKSKVFVFLHLFYSFDYARLWHILEINTMLVASFVNIFFFGGFLFILFVLLFSVPNI